MHFYNSNFVICLVDPSTWNKDQLLKEDEVQSVPTPCGRSPVPDVRLTF